MAQLTQLKNVETIVKPPSPGWEHFGNSYRYRLSDGAIVLFNWETWLKVENRYYPFSYQFESDLLDEWSVVEIATELSNGDIWIVFVERMDTGQLRCASNKHAGYCGGGTNVHPFRAYDSDKFEEAVKYCGRKIGNIKNVKEG